jgi:hypothetical protein
MTRVSPLLIGAALAAALGLGTEGYLLFRPHRRTLPANVAAPSPDDDSERPPAAARVSPAIVPSAPVAAQAPVPAAQLTPQQVQNVAVKKRALLMADHNQQIVQLADERAFDALQLSDEKRTAIRQINGNYDRSTRDFIDANPPDWRPGEQLGANIAKNDEADRARRAALKEVLGPEGVAAFETAEYAAARRLRRQHSAQWADELERQAPLPEGLPPSPH